MKPIIKVEDLSKQYRLGNIGTGSLRDDAQRWWHRVRGKEDPYLRIGETNDRSTKSKGDYVWALKDINFEVMPGEVLGIIGKNGAGKSTLLKILSKVTGPTTGRIDFNGRIASLLEVGTGFHPDLTGRENIFLNGAILGMTKREIRSRLDEIIDFSGCERYIDTPVKRYSSGMIVRLGFAVAAHLEPEILIVDEVLAVGDAEFQKKAIGKMQDVSRNEGRTVLFVSHNMGAVAQLCDSGVVLHQGRIDHQSLIAETIKYYLQNDIKVGSYLCDGSDKVDKEAYFKRIMVVDDERNERSDFFYDEAVYILFDIQINRSESAYKVFCMILDSNLKRVFAAETTRISDRVTLKISPKFLVRGDYSLHAFIHIPRIRQEDAVENVCRFKVLDRDSLFFIHGDYDYGSVFGNYEWVC